MNTNAQNTEKKQPSQVTGTLNQVAGNVKKNVGQAMNDDQMFGEGAVQEADGKTEKAMAKIKEAAKTAAHVSGDAVERVGDKLAQAGMPKLGAAVRNAGDKLEHSAD